MKLMLSLGLTAMVAMSVGCASNLEDNSAIQRQESAFNAIANTRATEFLNSVKCTHVVFFRPAEYFIERRSVVWEILTVDRSSGAYYTRGFVLNGDYGVFRICSSTLDFKVRRFLSPGSSRGFRRNPTAAVRLDLSEAVSYVLVDDHPRIALKEQAVKQIKALIDDFPEGQMTGNSLSEDRYRMFCPSCDLKPSDFPYRRNEDGS